MAKKTGRPRKEIDQKQFEQLCAMQCTESEIAAFFDCDISTLNRFCKREYGATFDEVSKKKREVGNISLRRMQFKHAEKSPSMAIFLGKQYLGQRDQVQMSTDLTRDEKDPLSLAFEAFMGGDNGNSGADDERTKS